MLTIIKAPEIFSNDFVFYPMIFHQFSLSLKPESIIELRAVRFLALIFKVILDLLEKILDRAILPKKL